MTSCFKTWQQIMAWNELVVVEDPDASKSEVVTRDGQLTSINNLPASNSGTYFLIQLQPRLVSLAIYILKAKKPDFPKTDRFDNLNTGDWSEIESRLMLRT